MRNIAILEITKHGVIRTADFDVEYSLPREYLTAVP